MQEFIEKLIGRLVEEVNFYDGVDIGVRQVTKIVKQLTEEIDKGKISDGYHTFDELYHHRAVLFAVICNSNKELAWKSKLHDTGDMYDGMFIVGIETPEGQATYHYDVNPYWDMFKVKELPKAPKWDGHTPDEAIRRITFLDGDNNDWIPCSERLPKDEELSQRKEVIAQNIYGEIFTAQYTYNCTHTHKDFFRDYCAVPCVIAWQPLPAPYQPKGE